LVKEKDSTMKRPATQEEVEKYEIEVERELMGLLKAKGMSVTIGGMSEEEYFSYERRKKFTKKSIWNEVTPSDKKKALKEVKEGKIPVKIELPVLIFGSTAAMPSGVPYLNVVATSWLDKKTPQNLPHALLSAVKNAT